MNDTPREPEPLIEAIEAASSEAKPQVIAAKTRLSRKRILFMVAIAAIGAALLSTLKQTATEEKKQIALTAAEIKTAQLKAEAEGAKLLLAQYRGLSTNGDQRALLTRVATAYTTKSDAGKSIVPLKFILLAEPNAINLYATSTGEVYVTTALLNRMQTEGQLAAAVAHGIAHVLGGDVLAPIAPANPKLAPSQWHFTTEAETKADAFAVRLMAQAGYDPNAMIGMFGVLAKAYQDKADVGFFTTHPNVDGRLEAIAASITAQFPQGVPAELSK